MDPNQNTNQDMPQAQEPAPMNEASQQSTAPEQTAPAKKSGAVGPMVGAIIVIALLILGALYYFGNNATDFLGLDPNSSEEAAGASEISEDVGTAAVEADAELEGLDSDLDDSMAELDAEFQ